MSKLEKHFTRLKLRIGFSILFFAGFMIGGSAAVITGNDSAIQGLFVLGIASIFVLPRQAVPRSQVPEDAAGRKLFGTLLRVQNWLSYLRVIYLLVVIFIIFGLPELV